jgi:hypothetical protein
MRKWFEVVGDYGPIGAMHHRLFIFTDNEQHARQKFAARIERDHPHDWRWMGDRNVDVFKVQ